MPIIYFISCEYYYVFVLLYLLHAHALFQNSIAYKFLYGCNGMNKYSPCLILHDSSKNVDKKCIQETIRLVSTINCLLSKRLLVIGSNFLIFYCFECCFTVSTLLHLLRLQPISLYLSHNFHAFSRASACCSTETQFCFMTYYCINP